MGIVKKKVWLWKAYDPIQGKILRWHLVNRNDEAYNLINPESLKAHLNAFQSIIGEVFLSF